VLCGLESSIVTRRAAYVRNPPGVKEQAAGVSEKCPNQPSMPSPSSFRGHLAPLSRRPYQPGNRFSSVSRPFLNVSGAASPRQPTPRTRIHQTTTIGLRRLNYVWIMQVEAGSCAGAEWEVIEKGGNGGVGGSVIARAENNWPADGNRWTRIAKRLGGHKLRA
jgi:hypothetical protein